MLQIFLLKKKILREQKDETIKTQLQANKKPAKGDRNGRTEIKLVNGLFLNNI